MTKYGSLYSELKLKHSSLIFLVNTLNDHFRLYFALEDLFLL